MKFVRIGELAERTGVETTTIRYYEGIGLLTEPDRTPARYRDYDETAVARLRFIRAAQSVGLTLGEIREVLGFRDRGEMPCRHVATLIERHAAELTERITALEEMRRDLERLARKTRTAPEAAQAPAAFCHIIEGGVGRRGL